MAFTEGLEELHQTDHCVQKKNKIITIIILWNFSLHLKKYTTMSINIVSVSDGLMLSSVQKCIKETSFSLE